MATPDDYDYAAAKKAGVKPDANGHWPDTYKKPNHITFSDESVYHSPQTPGGSWKRQSGKWYYTPSKYVLKQQGLPRLQQYFKENEPGSVLNVTQPRKAR